METTTQETAHGQLEQNKITTAVGGVTRHGLSLYDLSTELVRLMDEYDAAELSEDRAALEVELKLYAERHLRKVDGIRAYLKHCELMIDGARREIATQKAHEEAWEARRDRLKDLCLEVMLEFKTKRLDGNTGSLLLKGNGGKQPVTIANPELVPDEFCVYEGVIPAHLWKELATRRSFNGVRMVRTPRKSLIEAELQKPCETCLGVGSIPRDRPETIATCETCGGSGKRGVPGCTLEPRGVHLEVK